MNCHSSGELSPDSLITALQRICYGYLRCSLQVFVVDGPFTFFPLEVVLFLMGYGFLPMGSLVVHTVAVPSLDDVFALLPRLSGIFFITLSDYKEDAGDLLFRFTRSGAHLLGISELKAFIFNVLTSSSVK
ncbi:hypothetical protein TNIN_356951 [Trichonephila inaurata madagascariensis]|uniref:Uncharacterized protein n=1 Tax=Trichonephila inaurata madagascariensis TaxID=2747483 RepID=A0A8X6M943_9ARAC|nr:hypothetical protein TNIN_356951 [Trichonephila inaurata madagascariensis]